VTRINTHTPRADEYLCGDVIRQYKGANDLERALNASRLDMSQ